MSENQPSQSRAELLATTARFLEPTRGAADGPPHHQIDCRADAIAAKGEGHPDDLLTTRQMAEWFCLSVQWFEIGRSKGWGPPFLRLAPQVIRYHRGTARTWLLDRLYRSTAEYQK